MAEGLAVFRIDGKAAPRIIKSVISNREIERTGRDARRRKTKV